MRLTTLPSMAVDDEGLVHGGFVFGAALGTACQLLVLPQIRPLLARQWVIERGTPPPIVGRRVLVEAIDALTRAGAEPIPASCQAIENHERSGASFGAYKTWSPDKALDQADAADAADDVDESFAVFGLEAEIRALAGPVLGDLDAVGVAERVIEKHRAAHPRELGRPHLERVAAADLEQGVPLHPRVVQAVVVATLHSGPIARVGQVAIDASADVGGIVEEGEAHGVAPGGSPGGLGVSLVLLVFHRSHELLGVERRHVVFSFHPAVAGEEPQPVAHDPCSLHGRRSSRSWLTVRRSAPSTACLPGKWR